MLATDANGLPLGMLTTSAGIGEVRMAEATLATIAVPQEKGKPKSRPRQNRSRTRGTTAARSAGRSTGGASAPASR